MVYGGDFYDLASFYWATGEKNKAMQVAEEGLQKGKGCMDELRQVVAKIRYLLIEVLNDNERWCTFAPKVKQDNLKRPAFQEEFAKVVPGWRGLK